MVKPAGKLVLPVAEPLHAKAQLTDLLRQRFGEVGRARRGSHRHDQQDQDQHHKRCPKEGGQHKRIAKRKLGITDLNHVRPNRRSMSDRRNST